MSIRSIFVELQLLWTTLHEESERAFAAYAVEQAVPYEQRNQRVAGLAWGQAVANKRAAEEVRHLIRAFTIGRECGIGS
jgi:hypothetical protein